MPPTLSHTIQRQEVLIQAPNLAAARQVRQQAEQLCRGPVTAALDKILSAAVAPDRVLRIDRLTLELNISSPEQFEAEFLPGVESALRAALEKLGELRSHPASGMPAAVKDIRPDAAEALCHQNLPLAAAHRELLAFFLRSGRLPAWAQPEAADRLDAMLTDVLDQNSSGIRSWLASLLKDPIARRRLARQFPPESLARIAALLWHQTPGAVGQTVARLEQRIQASRPSQPPASPIREMVWEALLTLMAAAPDDRFDLDTLEARVLSSWPGETGAQKIVEAEPHPTPSPEGRKISSAKLAARPDLPAPDDHSPGQPEIPGPALPAAASSETVAVIEKHSLHTEAREPDVFSDAAPALAAIHNAGLVLLWPYLGRFFAGLGLTSAHGFIDTDAAERAVHLLQYLAWNSTESAEPHLLLNKILCGLPPETPVARGVLLAEAEILACEELLAAAIAHWHALKSTSISGLRTTFLQRFGLLSQAQGRWHLRVERQAFDLLLERLPWGIAAIKLSWMPKMLSVEW
ncbi:MAG: hypothetical protein HY911_01520 [Desulfobacterales bacterium]|nr:hypothetical protein [Desulfobacterales bacterium]